MAVAVAPPSDGMNSSVCAPSLQPDPGETRMRFEMPFETLSSVKVPLDVNISSETSAGRRDWEVILQNREWRMETGGLVPKRLGGDSAE